MSSIKDIKIAKYRANGAKIFTGRDNGVKARREFNLNCMDEEQGDIRVLIPTDTWGINPSFFGGMFESSIRKFGKDFLGKYNFCYTDGNKLSDSLNRDIIDDINYVIANIKVDE